MVLKAIAASLLLVGSVAVSGVSATAAPVEPYWLAQRHAETRVETTRVETTSVSEERSVSRTETRLRVRDQGPDDEIRLDQDFALGLSGGVGAEPSFDSSGGGGGTFASASASAGASASARVRASASFAARMHRGGHNGYHSMAHGCGCKR
jgi:hypothetical protein